MPFNPNYSYYPNQQGYTPNYQPQGNVYQQAPQMPTQAISNAVRTVYSEAEARAAQIPTDGSTIIFMDQSNGRIYTKQFSFENGSFLFGVFSQMAEQPPVQYATIDDLNKLREELMKKRSVKKDDE